MFRGSRGQKPSLRGSFFVTELGNAQCHSSEAIGAVSVRQAARRPSRSA
jgi:hypothetical protein